MDYLRDVLKRFDIVVKTILFLIAINLLLEILILVIPNNRLTGLSNYYLPDHYMYVYFTGLVLFVFRYVLSGRTSINLDKNDYLYHAGTKKMGMKVKSNGGRVLNFVSLSENFKKSRDKIIKKIKLLNWNNGFFRKDIGYKVIDE